MPDAPRCGRCGGKMLVDGIASEKGANFILYACHKCEDEVQMENNAAVPVQGRPKEPIDWAFGR